MVTRKKVNEELDFLTDRLSSQVRAIALGLIAITWGLLIGDVKLNSVISRDQRYGLLSICAIALFALFLDFLQYMFGYWYVNFLRKKMNIAKVDEYEKNEKDLRWQGRYFFFYAKQAFLVVAVVWLIVIMGNILCMPNLGKPGTVPELRKLDGK